MMANLREGDIINVHSLDRVGRNTKDILEIVQQVKDKGCLIHFHKETFANGRFMAINMVVLDNEHGFSFGQKKAPIK
jgi:DNA invertase Pin-like site-specific DNA recombinase